MSRLRLALISACVLFCLTKAFAVQPPIAIFPDPVNFGTVAEYSVGYPQIIYVTNTSNSTVNVTGMAIGGGNASNFAFDGPNCTGQISAGQTCMMYLTFTPTIIGNLSATLKVSFTGSGSPIAIPLSGSGGDPLPALTSISPSGAYAGSAGVTVTIKGNYFIPTSVAYWGYGSTPLATTYISATQLTAQIPASDLESVTSGEVYVSNPPPGGGSSGDITFNVLALDPTLYNISPTSVVAGNGGTIASINGGNFMTGATVLWNGKRRTTTYVSPTELQVQLTAKDFLQPSIIPVSVSNPSPGGVSGTLNFNVTYPAIVRTLNLPANDIVWDPLAQKIYASLPSSFGTNGNSIAVIDPTRGSVIAYYYAGSEPTQMAISADSSYLYVGLNGSGSIQRFMLPSFTPDINFSLGVSYYGGLNTAGALAVSPGDPHTLAVSIGSAQCCSSGPLEFFEDSTLLPDNISYPYVSSIQFVSGTLLYGYASGTLSQINVTSQGGTLGTQWSSQLTGSAIVYNTGLIYDNNGNVFNPSTGSLLGKYDVLSGYNSGSVLPEAAIDKTFALGITPFFSSFGITSYNLSQFTPEAVINLGQFSGTISQPPLSWGNNGIAFILGSGCCGTETYQIQLIQSSMMQAAKAK